MYVALDLGQKNIQVVLKNKDGNIIKENKIQLNTKTILEFIDDNSNKEKDNNKNHNNIDVVMESGYNYQYLYDLLQDEGYNVKVAHPLMVKAIAYSSLFKNIEKMFCNKKRVVEKIIRFHFVLLLYNLRNYL